MNPSEAARTEATPRICPHCGGTMDEPARLTSKRQPAEQSDEDQPILPQPQFPQDFPAIGNAYPDESV